MKSVEFGMSGSDVEYSTGTNTKEVTDEARHEATEEDHDGLEDDFGGAADVGDPDAGAPHRAGNPTVLSYVLNPTIGIGCEAQAQQ